MVSRTSPAAPAAPGCTVRRAGDRRGQWSTAASAPGVEVIGDALLDRGQEMLSAASTASAALAAAAVEWLARLGTAFAVALEPESAARCQRRETVLFR